MHYDIKYTYCINDLKYIFRNATLLPNNNNTFLFNFVKALQTTKKWRSAFNQAYIQQ